MSFWVGGSGNTSNAAAHWAATSGGAPGAGNLPTSVLDAHFDALSSTIGYTVTLDATFNCRDLMFDVAPSGSGTITFTGSAAINCYGSQLSLLGMVDTYSGTITFKSTTLGKTITRNLESSAALWVFDGIGGGWTLQDNLIVTGNDIILTNGSLNTNSKAVSCRNFNSNTDNVGRSLTLGSTVFTTLNTTNNQGWQITATPGRFTLDAGTSTIVMTGVNPGFNGAGLQYYDVTHTNANGYQLFNNVNTFRNYTHSGGASNTMIGLVADQNFTGTLAITGTGQATRAFISSTTASGTITPGVTRTITAPAISLPYTDFMDITGAGAASWVGTSLGDCGGNSNITFAPPKTVYGVCGATAKNWTSNIYAATTGGAVNIANFPMPQDTLIFDANSFTAPGVALASNYVRWCKNVSFLGVTNNPILAVGSGVPILFGDVTLDPNMTVTVTTGTMLWANHSPLVFRTNGVVMDVPITINALGSTVTLGDALTMGSTRTLTLTAGTFIDNGYSVTIGSYIRSGTAVRAQNATGAWTITGSVIPWGSTTTTNLTVISEPSVIKFTDATSAIKTMTGGGLAYNTVQLTGAGSGAFQFSGVGNSIANLVIDNLPKSIQFTAGTTTTVGGVTVPPYNPADVKFVRLLGGSDCFTTPDTASIPTTGDQEIEILFIPTAQIIETILIGQCGNVPNVGWEIHINPLGRPILYWSPDGTASIAKGGTVSLINDILVWLKVTQDVDNDAGGNDIKFWTAPDVAGAPGTYTQLGTTITTAGVTVNYSAIALFDIGGRNGGGAQATYNFSIYRAKYKAAIGGATLVDFNPNDWVSGNTWVSSTTGETWTRNGQALIYPEYRESTIGGGAGTHTITKSGGGTILIPKANVDHSIAAPANTFYGTNQSINGGTNTNWTFNWPPWLASSGSFTIQGSDVALLKLAALSTLAGAFIESGNSATLLKVATLISSVGGFSVDGQVVNLLKLSRMLAGAGEIDVTEMDANLLRSFCLFTQNGAFDIDENVANLFKLSRLFTEPGGFDVQGQIINLVKEFRLFANAGALDIAGQDVMFRRLLILLADAGQFDITENLAALLKNSKVYAHVGEFILDGKDVDFMRPYRMLSETGEFIVSGKNAKFWRPFHERIIKIEAENRTAAVEAEYRNVAIPEEL